MGSILADRSALAAQRRQIAREFAHDRAVIEERKFLQAWENGEILEFSAFVRIRQIRRAEAYCSQK